MKIDRHKFCSKGHDKDIVGRVKNGRCGQCYIDYIKEYKQRIKNGHIAKPTVQFCPQGHDTFIVGRVKQNGGCAECQKILNTICKEKNKEKAKVQKKIWRETHKELVKEQKQQWEEGHKEEIIAYGKQYAIEHKEEKATYRKENYLRDKEVSKKWKKEHPESLQATKIKQQTNRNLRIVAWTDWEEIKKVYKNKPVSMTVDHYIPVCGDGIAGLHVSWNLQYLSRSDNSKKINKCDKLEASEWYGKILEQAGLK